MTRLVVGLGNPGREYASTRHNAGFLVIDLLGDDLRASYWKDQGGAKVAVVRFGGEDLVLAKPQTFMNLSGSSVKKLAELYNAEVPEIIVVHDDIDLAAGDRALQGVRVMATRPESPADPLAGQLRALGAEVIVQPAIRIAPPLPYEPWPSKRREAASCHESPARTAAIHSCAPPP